LLLCDRSRPAIWALRRVVHSRCDHAEKQIGPVILNRTTKDLLLDWNSRRAFDATQSVNGRTDAQVANTLGNDVSWLLAICALLPILDWDLGISDANGTDITSKNVTAVQGLASSDSIIKAFEVD
jgi:hypothetical protein